jgi:hypothetical protein
MICGSGGGLAPLVGRTAVWGLRPPTATAGRTTSTSVVASGVQQAPAASKQSLGTHIRVMHVGCCQTPSPCCTPAAGAKQLPARLTCWAGSSIRAKHNVPCLCRQPLGEHGAGAPPGREGQACELERGGHLQGAGVCTRTPIKVSAATMPCNVALGMGTTGQSPSSHGQQLEPLQAACRLRAYLLAQQLHNGYQAGAGAHKLLWCGGQ